MILILALFQVILGFVLLKMLPSVEINNESSPEIGAVVGFFALICFTTAYYLLTN